MRARLRRAACDHSDGPARADRAPDGCSEAPAGAGARPTPMPRSRPPSAVTTLPGWRADAAAGSTGFMGARACARRSRARETTRCAGAEQCDSARDAFPGAPRARTHPLRRRRTAARLNIVVAARALRAAAAHASEWTRATKLGVRKNSVQKMCHMHADGAQNARSSAKSGKIIAEVVFRNPLVD